VVLRLALGGHQSRHYLLQSLQHLEPQPRVNHPLAPGVGYVLREGISPEASPLFREDFSIEGDVDI